MFSVFLFHIGVHHTTRPSVDAGLWAFQLGKGCMEMFAKCSHAGEIRASQLREGWYAQYRRRFIVSDELVHRQ